jgi:hypothetical protein
MRRAPPPVQVDDSHPLLVAARHGRLDALKQQLGEMGPAFAAVADKVLLRLRLAPHTTTRASRTLSTIPVAVRVTLQAAHLTWAPAVVCDGTCLDDCPATVHHRCGMTAVQLYPMPVQSVVLRRSILTAVQRHAALNPPYDCHARRLCRLRPTRQQPV